MQNPAAGGKLRGVSSSVKKKSQVAGGTNCNNKEKKSEKGALGGRIGESPPLTNHRKEGKNI